MNERILKRLKEYKISKNSTALKLSSHLDLLKKVYPLGKPIVKNNKVFMSVLAERENPIRINMPNITTDIEYEEEEIETVYRLIDLEMDFSEPNNVKYEIRRLDSEYYYPVINKFATELIIDIRLNNIVNTIVDKLFLIKLEQILTSESFKTFFVIDAEIPVVKNDENIIPIETLINVRFDIPEIKEKYSLYDLLNDNNFRIKLDPLFLVF